MYYVKNDIGTKFQLIPTHYKQEFRYRFSVTGVNKNEIIKARNKGRITDRDLEIARFLFTHTFATASQINKFLETKGYKKKDRLEHLVNMRILNSFVLRESDLDKIGNDALIIYCLDFGGKYLVSNYGGEDTSDWYSTNNMKGSNLIVNHLISTQFYVNLYASSNQILTNFKKGPAMKVADKHVNPFLEFSLKVNFQSKHFIGEVVLNGDEAISFRDQILKLEAIFTTNAWRKYYVDVEQPPIFIIIAENDMVARDAAQILNRSTEIENKKVLITTLDRMNNIFYDKGTFLMYDNNSNKLGNVVVNTFKPV